MPSAFQIEQLKTRLAALSRHEVKGRQERFTLGLDRVDAYLDPGPCLFCLHDIHAKTAADAVAANAFGFGLATRATRGLPLMWVIENLAGQEAGGPYGPGLHEWGSKPEAVFVVRVRDTAAMLAAGEEALKSGAVGAVLMSGWGDAKALSLTASQRLALAARAGGSTAFAVRAGTKPGPSAAETRWSVRAALSTALEGGAPGRPAFVAALTRSRKGAAPTQWTMEWDREAGVFAEPASISGRRVSAPVLGSAPARRIAAGMRLAG